MRPPKADFSLSLRVRLASVPRFCCAPITVDPQRGGAMKIMPKTLAALAGQALASIEEDEVMPMKRGRL
jgi:hypothetical protein